MVYEHVMDIPPKSHFIFNDPRDLGNRALSVDRADEIESIDSVRPKKAFFLVN